MLDLVINTAIALFVTIDPIGVGPVFAALTRDNDARQKRRLAIRGTLIAAAILFTFAFVGDVLLEALGIGFPAFRIAGGILLLLVAVDMVLARPSGASSATPGEVEEATHRADISVFPLAIPLIAGPGAMTSVLLYMRSVRGDPAAQAAVLAVLAGVLAITLVVLLFAARVSRVLGVTGTNVISRVLGILLAALACQFIIDGLKNSGIAC